MLSHFMADEYSREDDLSNRPSSSNTSILEDPSSAPLSPTNSSTNRAQKQVTWAKQFQDGGSSSRDVRATPLQYLPRKNASPTNVGATIDSNDSTRPNSRHKEVGGRSSKGNAPSSVEVGLVKSNDTGIQSNDTSTQSNDTSTQSNDTGKQSNDTSTQSNDTGKQSNDTNKTSNDTGKQSNDTGKQSNDTGTQSNDTSTQSNDTGTQSNDTSTQSNDTSTQSNDTSTQSNDTGKKSNDTSTQSNDTGKKSNDTGSQSNDTRTHSQVTNKKFDVDSDLRSERINSQTRRPYQGSGTNTLKGSDVDKGVSPSVGTRVDAGSDGREERVSASRNAPEASSVDPRCTMYGSDVDDYRSS